MSLELGKIIADFTTSLATSIAIGGTTATLASATDDDGVALPSGTYYFTIDGANSSKEHIQCTLSGTSISVIKSVSRQGALTTGVARAHRIGTSVTITDHAHLLAVEDVLITGYASATTPTTDYQLSTKKYVDDAAFAGGTNATTTNSGFVELPTQAETDARTANGSAGPLAVIPSTLRATKYHDAVASATGTDAYAITVVPAITAYATGQEFTFIADVANTTGATLNVSGVGAKTITKDVSTALATGDILAGQVIKVMYDGTNMQIVSILNNIAKTATVEVFTADGTYTMPANAKLLEVICIGAGGAGGSGGAKYNNSAQYSGGTGGGGGAKVIGTFIAAGITSQVTVTVATAPATDTAGGYSSFGTYLKAYGGGKGKFPQGNGENNTGAGGGGSMGVGADGTTTGTVLGGAPASVAGAVGFASQGAGGNNGADGVRAEYGGASGGGGLHSDVGKKGGSSLFGGAGGGAGGGIDGSTPGNPATSGAEGGASNSIVAGGGGAGGTSSGAGTAGTSRSGTGLCGDGGGGGGAKATSTAGAGGAGGIPGGGGGGGGSTAFERTPVAGGAGGRGEVIVITYF